MDLLLAECAASIPTCALRHRNAMQAQTFVQKGEIRTSGHRGMPRVALTSGDNTPLERF
jgi:hypothetical protein